MNLLHRCNAFFERVMKAVHVRKDSNDQQQSHDANGYSSKTSRHKCEKLLNQFDYAPCTVRARETSKTITERQEAHWSQQKCYKNCINRLLTSQLEGWKPIASSKKKNESLRLPWVEELSWYRTAWRGRVKFSSFSALNIKKLSGHHPRVITWLIFELWKKLKWSSWPLLLCTLLWVTADKDLSLSLIDEYADRDKEEDFALCFMWWLKKSNWEENLVKYLGLRLR